MTDEDLIKKIEIMEYAIIRECKENRFYNESIDLCEFCKYGEGATESITKNDNGWCCWDCPGCKEWYSDKNGIHFSFDYERYKEEMDECNK